MPTELLFYIVGIPAVFMIGFGKGAFGGGLAIIGIPFLALVTSPVDAAIIVAIVASTTDIFAVQAFPMRTWSWPDIVWLAPAMIVGLALGTLFFVLVDPRVLGMGVATITLLFTARYFLRDRLRSNAEGAPVQPIKALACGTLAGFTTFVAHSGAPPIAMYLLPRALGKTMFAGTTVALLTFSNVFKIVPYLWVGLERPQAFWQALPLLPAIPLGVWLGKRLHDRLDEQRLYFWCYVLVGAAGLKLLADSVRQILA
jgi:uncharacterized membrane protein YfcA